MYTPYSNNRILGIALLALLSAKGSAQEEPAATTATSSTSSSSVTIEASSTSTSTSAASDGPQTHEVKVGLGGFAFDPDELEAEVGDTIRFVFYPPDHSVVRAHFGYPCIPYEYVSVDGEPFYSDVQWVNTVSDTTTFEITVNDTDPIFYYCGADNSCLGKGMIGVINPTKDQSLQAQKDAREDFPIELVPGEEWPAEDDHAMTATGLAVTSTATGQSSATSTSKSHDSGPSTSSHHGLTAGQIAGIAIGGAALLIIVGVLIYWAGRRGGVEKGYRKSLGLLGGDKSGKDGGMEAGFGGTPSLDPSKLASAPHSPGMPVMTPQSQYTGYMSPEMHQQQHYQYHPAPVQAHEVAAEGPVELPASANTPVAPYSMAASPGAQSEHGYKRPESLSYNWTPQENITSQKQDEKL